MVRRHKPDLFMGLLVIVVMSIGLLTMFAIGPRVVQSMNMTYGTHTNEYNYFIKHAITVALSIAAIFVGYNFKYNKINGKIATILVAASVFLCVCVRIFGALGASFVTCDKGACRAFRVMGFGFMPSELLKVAALYYMAWLIRDRKAKDELDTPRFYVPLATLLLLVVIALAWLESDFGSTVVIATMIFAMMWVGGVSLKRLLIMLGIVLAGAGLLVAVTPYRVERILASDTYHVESSLVSIGTGGLFGVGFGNSVQSTGYLPEAMSDSIFSIICEVVGFVGAGFVLLCFTVILWRMLTVAQRTRELDCKLFVVGVFAWIVAHVIINIGGMTGLLPMKGITLPFLSYGGTSMLFVAYAVGVVLQISSWTAGETIKEDEDTSSRRGQRGTRYSSSSRRS